MVLIIIPIFLLLINLWLFLPFFGLGLFGDDWLAIFRYSYYLDEPKHLGLYSTEYFNHFKYLLNAYGSQDMLMAYLYKTFGEYSGVYFILSYILRVGAGFSIYFPAYYLTKNKLSAYFAVFFFLFSSIGLEASSWVFNMPSYLYITFFSFLVYFYLKYQQENKIKSLYLSYLFFTLTFLSTPIRAHGLIPFIIFMEILWLIFKRNWVSFKLSLMKISGFFAILFVIYILGFKETLSGSPTAGFIAILKNSLSLLSQNRFDFLFYPLATLGNIFIPDTFLPKGWQITNFNQYLYKIVLPISLAYITIAIILTYHIGNLGRKFISSVAIMGVVWITLVLIIYKFNPATFSNANNASSLLIGGYILIMVTNLFFYLKSNNLIRSGLLIAFGWTIISYLYPSLQSNTAAIFSTTHRYLIVSNVGISMLLAILIGLGKNSKRIFTLVIISSVLLMAHTFSIRNFLNVQYQTHERSIVKKIWSQIPYVEKVGKSTEPLIFYFEGDGTNETILRDSVTFGFPPHMALLYGITEENKNPQPMSDWREVEFAVLDGTSPDRIYAFHLQGKDNLINITDLAREKLSELIKVF